MKDDAKRMALARADAADAVSHPNAGDAARSTNGAMIHGERHAVALCQRDDFGA